MTARPVRLVMVDDHEMVLHGIMAMLTHFSDDVTIVGTATGSADAISLIRSEAPDVVLCDVRLGKDSGLDLCRQIKATNPKIKVVFLTVYEDEQYVYQALRVDP
jgi:DNA-binding NarL/FixJ family response regulator